MISVIICTYNRERCLEKTLVSFFAQSGLDDIDHELVVVDNNSSDDTRETVQRLQDRGRFRYVFEPRQGLSAARNRGVRETSGDIVAFLDDDVLVDPRWLIALRSSFDETAADAVGGRSYLVFDVEPPEWFGPDFHALLSEVNLGDSRTVVPRGRGLAGLNLAFRRSALAAAGGFNEALGRRGASLLGTEETTIMRQIAASGGVIVYEPNAVVGHMIEADRVTWAYFVRLSAGMGKSMAVRDREATFGGRVRAVFRSIGAFRWHWTTWMGEVVRRGTLYERRRARRRVLARRSRLATEIALLWRAK